MKTLRMISVTLLVPLAACMASTTWQAGVAHQAAFDHKCREDQIKVLRFSDVEQSRTVDLSVCGTARRYRDIGGRGYVWVDVTTGFPAGTVGPASP